MNRRRCLNQELFAKGKTKLKIWNVDFQGNIKQNKVLHVSLQVSLFDVKLIIAVTVAPSLFILIKRFCITH